MFILHFVVFSIAFSYDGLCHYRCDGCNGPTSTDCIECVQNGHKENDIWVCDSGFTGSKCTNYIGIWYDKCDRCNGPKAYNCIKCIDNAVMTVNNECVCNDGYAGPDWFPTAHRPNYPSWYDDSQNPFYEPYNANAGPNPYSKPSFGPQQNPNNTPYGSYGGYDNNSSYYDYDYGDNYHGNDNYHNRYYNCSPKCVGGCTGPTSKDCISCVAHSRRDVNGYCVWEQYYYGDQCNQYGGQQYNGKCHNLCLVCNGPDLSDCISCVANAHADMYGFCVCNEGYYGDGCQKSHYSFSGKCHPYCSGSCTGPEAKDCYEWAEHAHRDTYNYCTCDEGFGGIDCNTSLSYQGPCSPVCLESCFGPSPSECDACVMNSHLDSESNCVCDDDWDGDACNRWNYKGPCNPKWVECVGPDPNDCLSCVPNAVWSSAGCECNVYWKGDDCSKLVYEGVWDSKCSGCLGPGADECIRCVTNASLNEFGYCICDPFWQGESCQNYEKGCHQRCSQWSGPLATDCTECVKNAKADAYGICMCERNWSGDRCETYAGPCQTVCDGCFGPGFGQCDFCVEHSHRDEYSNCVCDMYWSEGDCSHYIGPCNGICNGCDGPGSGSCTECVENAIRDENGWCICDYYWAGPSCMVYEGACYERCDTCMGPKANDCLVCVENSALDEENGFCNCEHNWSGGDCSIYTGSCDPVCYYDQCYGPGSDECTRCTPNAYRNKDGFCQCLSQWKGSDCAIWAGACSNRWLGCGGPHPSDCQTCIANALFSEDGQCVCSSEWTSSDCSVWKGSCDSRCSGCDGPSNIECLRCVDLAHRGVDGGCICNSSWSGTDCSAYSGICNNKCNGCTGPSDMECIQCAFHAFRGLDGSCQCNESYSGFGCYYYSGVCDPRCSSGCTGPSNSDCLACATQAYKNHQGEWVCWDDWKLHEDCSVWSGNCAPTCESCIGPGTDQCLSCVQNAARNLANGECQCDPSWDDHLRCAIYLGQCKPTCELGECIGPSGVDCLICREHSYRDLQGACVCSEDWGADNCTHYSGMCDIKWENCTGPSDRDCTECGLNAELNHDGSCVCMEGWRGKDCQTWAKSCDPKCLKCYGPLDSQCIHCRDNAFRDHNGRCICMPQWEGESCTKEIIQCHPSCAECDGKQSFSCTSCPYGTTLQLKTPKAGFCLPCHENCKECYAIGPENCTACHSGKTAIHGKCECCSEECDECSGINKGECTACYPDAVLTGTRCQCIHGKLHPITMKCEERCPSSLSGDYWEHIEPLTFDFDGILPWQAREVTADSCHPPFPLRSRGVAFNGSSSFFELINFEGSLSLNFQFWIRLKEKESTLMSYAADWNQSIEKEDCNSAPTNLNRLVLDFWVTSCVEMVVDIGDTFRMYSEEQAVSTGHWNEIIFSMKTTGSSIKSTEVIIEVNGHILTSGSAEGIQLYRDIQSQLFIGSHLGMTYFMDAILFSLEYSTDQIKSNAIPLTATEYTNGLIREQDNCDANEFFYFSEQGCHACHASCTSGCTDSTPCSTCHSTCKSCEEGGEGDENACTSCWCGSDLHMMSDKAGYCVCQESWVGKADSCNLRCYEGCSICTASYIQSCEYCEQDYELDKENQTCSYCEESGTDPDGFTRCGVRGGKKPISECSCKSSEWFDGEQCQSCPANCSDCEQKVGEKSMLSLCTACAQGSYFAPETDICLGYCATGFVLNSEGTHCVGMDSCIAKFAFSMDEDTHAVIWKSEMSWNNEDLGAHLWDVRVHSGLPGDAELMLEPFVIDDRGLWFDGKDDMARFDGLILNHTFSIEAWIRPHGDGAIFGVGDASHYDYSRVYYWGIEEGKILFSDLHFEENYASEHDMINFYWTHVALTVQWFNEFKINEIMLWESNLVKGSHISHHMILGYPQNIYQETTLGTVEDSGIFILPYRGYIFTFNIYNHALRTFSDSIQTENCLGDIQCNSCPAVTGACPGVCNWNHYWNGQRCQRCPTECKGGCQRDGLC